MKQPSTWHEKAILQVITIGVIGNGLSIMAGTLLSQLRLRSFHNLSEALITLPLVSGLTLVYLGMLLHRRKQAAWAILVPLYGFILGLNVIKFEDYAGGHRPELFLRSIFLPLCVVAALIVFRRVFTVKSAIQNFSVSLRAIVILLAVILAYGTAGYLLLDQRDFHQEISAWQAIHRTIDQFDLTTNQQLTPYTRRAAVFVDSLNILSAVAIGYTIISLFQPIRAKLTSQAHHREQALELLQRHSNDSEDFFKIWPTDKTYFSYGLKDIPQAMIAYRVQRGVAVVAGDPVGSPANYHKVIAGFDQLCQVNDWLPAVMHITENSLPVYEKRGYQTQKIGEEAVVSVKDFMATTAHNKYFRQIQNKFSKQHYGWELLQPPHQAEAISRLREVSQDWLSLPGRQERGFMMGYFNDNYLQQGPILVARDATGTIHAFLNQVPTYQSDEANFDMLRHTKKSLGNVNDYLLMAFIETAHQQGYKTVNLGLCPLSGLDKETEDKSVIDWAMRFVYANGNRFYSFSGLHRFKSKYEPTWRSRYMAYKGGVRGFTRAIYSLNKVMSRTR